MAENKKSFVLYCDTLHMVSKLPNDKAGELFKHLLRYVNDENPETEDLIIQIAFEPIKQQLKRDLKKWELEKEEKSIGGRMGNLKRWNNILYQKVIAKELTLEQAEEIASNRIASHTDTNQSDSIASVAVSVSVTDNVSVNGIVTDTNTLVDEEAKKNFLNFKEELLKDQHYIETCCVTNKISEEEFGAAISEYFNKKVATTEFIGMTKRGIRKNFMFWIPDYQKRQRADLNVKQTPMGKVNKILTSNKELQEWAKTQ